MSIRNLLAVTVLASSGLVGLAAAASAAESQSTTVRVRYADLDLTSDAGVATLNQRVQAAARRVCGPVDNRDLAEVGRLIECQQTAMASARAKVQEAMAAGGNHPQYAMLPAAKTVAKPAGE